MGKYRPSAHGVAHVQALFMSEYDTDLVLWSREQADLLRLMAAGERVNDQVDWENVAEEIESLGRSDWRELRRRTGVILRHRIKLHVSPAVQPRAGWRRTIVEQRGQMRILLDDNPSLLQRVSEAISVELPTARELALSDLAEFGDQPIIAPDSLTFAPEQVLGPGLPD
jgi:hypothetical protein